MEKTEYTHEGSDFQDHTPCTQCGSSDACALYSDGHTHCFACGAHGSTAEGGAPSKTRKKALPPDLIYTGSCRALRKRRISKDTCDKFGYQVAKHQGQTVHVAPYYDADGELVAQKIRFPNKDFVILGKIKTALPFGAQAWAKSGKMLVVTEGEIDALSMSQVQGNKWPVVSIGNGAESAKKSVATHKEYYDGFETVVLMFDMDAPGRKAAKAAAEVLGMRARIAELPEGFKDPNEMLLAGKTQELIQAMWRAREYRPEGIVDMTSLREEVRNQAQWGRSLPWPTLTKMTFGLRLGEIWTWGAGTGIGKTTVFTQLMRHLSAVHKKKVAGFFLEQQPKETALRVAGMFVEKPLHVPDAGWTEADVDKAWELMQQSGKVFLYDSFGNNTWPVLKNKIEYMAHAEEVQYFVIDHLTALATWQDDEREALDKIMSDMGGLVKKLNINIQLVSHLATPDGKPHEEGGRVTIRHFRGSRSIGYWSHFMIGLERNQQAESLTERNTTIMRVLKDRYTGRSVGETIPLLYDRTTGLLREGDGTVPDAVAETEEEEEF